MSPPTGSISTSRRSVSTRTGAAAGAAAVPTGGAFGAEVADGATVPLEGAGAGGAGSEGIVVAGLVAWGSAALCFCHDSHRRSADSEKTISAMIRCVSIIIRKISGNRVEAAGMPRMAAADAPRREQRTLERAVAAERLDRVLGAARREAALIAPPGAQCISIRAHERDEEPRDQRPRPSPRRSKKRVASARIAAAE